MNNGQQQSTSAASPSAGSHSNNYAHQAGAPSNSSASTSSLQEFVANAVNSVAQTLGSAFGAASSLAATSSSTGLQGNEDKPRSARKVRAKQQPDPNETIDLTKDDEDSNDVVEIADDEVIVLKATIPRRPGDKIPGPLCRTRGTEVESIGCNCCKNRHVPHAEVVVQSANNHEEGSSGSPSGKKGRRGVSPSSASTPPALLPQSQGKGYKCPICLEVIEPDKPDSQRKMASTNCGHIFCFDCIKDAIKVSKQCPKCRKKLTVKGYHQIFISFD